MITIKAAEMIDWATPGAETFAPYAASIEEMQQITAGVTAVRRDFLVHEARHEMLRRQGGAEDEEQASMNFADIPAKFILTRNDFDRLSPSYAYSEAWPFEASPRSISPYWGHLADVQAWLEGFAPFTSKYSDFNYSEPYIERCIDFSKRWEAGERPPVIERKRDPFLEGYLRSLEIAESGYPVRMLMAGANYLRSAAIDMTSVEAYIAWRKNSNTDFIYFTPQSFWPHMVEVKRADDEKRGLKTYAPLVSEVGEGVYAAPYVADEVIATNEYFNFDDTYRLAVREGYAQKVGARAFRLIVLAALGGKTHGQQVEPYFKSGSMIKQSGVIFCHHSVLTTAIDTLYEKSKGKDNQTTAIAQKLWQTYEYGERVLDIALA